jgi:hypothetical protein
MSRANPTPELRPRAFSVRHPDPLPVSVILAAYDAQPFIAETLASVRAQTARPAEVIVVDDASHDQTASIAESFGATVLRNRHGGPALARNVGIRAASSEWVAFLDADDLWLPGKLEAQWAAVEACPAADFIFTDFSQGIPGEIQIASLLSSRQNYQQVHREVHAPGVVSCERQSRDSSRETSSSCPPHSYGAASRSSSASSTLTSWDARTATSSCECYTAPKSRSLSAASSTGASMAVISPRILSAWR